MFFCERGIGWKGLYFAGWGSDNRFKVLYMFTVNLLVGFDYLNNFVVKLA